MQSILVATDGSDNANQAIELASTISTALKAQLNIVHVLDTRALTEEEIQLLTIEFGNEIDKYITDKDIDNIPESRSGYLRKHQEQAGIFHKIIGSNIMDSAVTLSKEHGVIDPNTHLRTGEAAECILSVAKTINADLIIVGNRGQSKIQSLLMGSVSSKVNQVADIPVLIVK